MKISFPCEKGGGGEELMNEVEIIFPRSFIEKKNQSGKKGGGKGKITLFFCKPKGGKGGDFFVSFRTINAHWKRMKKACIKEGGKKGPQFVAF